MVSKLMLNLKTIKMKASKIKIREDYDKKLRKLRVRTKFVNNVINSECNAMLGNGKDPQKWLSAWEKSPDAQTFYQFIIGCFVFDDTPEGSRFWWRISES